MILKLKLREASLLEIILNRGLFTGALCNAIRPKKERHLQLLISVSTRHLNAVLPTQIIKIYERNIEQHPALSVRYSESQGACARDDGDGSSRCPPPSLPPPRVVSGAFHRINTRLPTRGDLVTVLITFSRDKFLVWGFITVRRHQEVGSWGRGAPLARTAASERGGCCPITCFGNYGAYCCFKVVGISYVSIWQALLTLLWYCTQVIPVPILCQLYCCLEACICVTNSCVFCDVSVTVRDRKKVI